MTNLRLIALLGLLVGCGSTPETVDVDEAFHRIQRHEATIAHRSAAAAACRGQGECDAELELCEAVEALCEVSRSIDDPDARTRCRSARRQCPEGP